jgi:acyl-CoA dehydrogenase
MKQKYSATRKDEKNKKDLSGKTAWRCDNCGEIHYGDEPPQECPYCLFPNQPFKKVDSQE